MEHDPRYDCEGRGCVYCSEEIRDRQFKAMMLSGGNLKIFLALWDGEAVPVEQLDAEWVKRYGRKR